jgi:hypothetical protein
MGIHQNILLIDDLRWYHVTRVSYRDVVIYPRMNLTYLEYPPINLSFFGIFFFWF